MNRKLLAVFVMIAALGASNAFASRARILTMGEGTGGVFGLSGGSFYYDDNRNIFYNPSYVNDFKNWASIEKSNGGANTGTPGALNAEGGFVTSIMNFSVGAYFNRGDAISGSYAMTNSDMRPIDLIFGGDMGIKWGAGITMGSFKVGDNTDMDLTLRLGAQIQGFEPFVAFKVMGDDKNSAPGTTLKNKMIGVGTRYKWGEWTPYVAWQQMKVDDLKVYESGGLGLGRSTDLTEGVKLNYAVGFWRQMTSGRNVVPIEFSAEASVASWMTGRGGFNYHLWDRTGGDSTVDATSGRIGATFHLGKADLDWAVGHSLAGTGAETASNLDTQYFDLSGFFTAASFTYRW